MDERKLLDLVSLFGYRLAMAGAETYRVEESMTFILKTYGFDSEVFCIPNCLSVSIDDSEGNPVYRMRRLGSHGTDLDCVERYSNLSRKICQEKPDLETLSHWMKETESSRLHYPFLVQILAGYLCGFGFSVLFGGTIPDGICGGVVGIVIMLVDHWMSKNHANAVFSTMASAFFAEISGYLIANFIFPHTADAAIIGALMILVPGMLFTNAMRDIMYGDTNSGIIRTALVVLQSISIALGTAAALFLIIRMWGNPVVVPKVQHGLFLLCLASFIGSTSFAMQFNVQRGWILCAVGGMLAWTVYYFVKQATGHEVLSMFVAALFAAFYAEVMARVRKYPAISYLVVANIPLFPGSGVYYTMFYAVQGDMEAFAAKGFETAAVAGAIALAILLVSTCFRMWSLYCLHRKIRLAKSK